MPTGVYVRPENIGQIMRDAYIRKARKIKCVNCGKECLGLTKWQKFCSPMCGVRYRPPRRLPCSCGALKSPYCLRCRKCWADGQAMKAKHSLATRFFKHVKKTDNCWIWTGAKTIGYGRITVNTKCVLATRVSYQIHKGVIPDGLLVLHRCDNPPCVNPDHLYLGDHSQNLKDAWDRGLRKKNNREAVCR